jgi:hypothetical protein
MSRVLLTALVFAGLVVQLAVADSHRHTPADGLEIEIARLLQEQAESVRCDASHFIFGVGYIDGSYMERIFYVEGAGDTPAVTVEFRGNLPPEIHADGQILPELPGLSFVMELATPRVLHATPAGDGWRVSDDGWETALRFKFTNWFGEIRRESGEWKIEWQGYRRPMLPRYVIDNREAICAMFAGR